MSLWAQLQAVSVKHRRGYAGLAICVVAIAVGVWSASGGPGKPGASGAQSAPPLPALDIALLRQVAAAAPDQNLVLSPFSLSMAAIPLLVGTTGDVQREWGRPHRAIP